MSYPWYGLGAATSIPPHENSSQNGSLTHSPATLARGSDSPGSSQHIGVQSGGFPPSFPTLSASSTQQSDSLSQSPHAMSHPSPGTYLPPLGAENSFQQHLYSSHNRFASFSSDGVPSVDQNFSQFGMTPSSMSSLSQSYAMRSQAYPSVGGYGEGASQQDLARFNAYSSAPYSTAGFENYYSHFDGRSMTGSSQSPDSQLMSAADRLIKPDPFENGMPRPGANPWQFAADSRDGLYLGSGYTPPVPPYGGPLPPLFHTNSHYRPMNYDAPQMPPHFKSDPSDPYAIGSPGLGGCFSPQQLMYSSTGKKSPKKKDSSPTPKPPTNPSDSPPVPNKASRYFSDRGIFMFVPPESGPSMGPYPGMHMISIADRYILCQKALCQRLAEVDLPPKVTYVYNPLEYAFETHYKFVKKYYNSTKRVLFLGMNPGPFGMSQNGVPFGECNIVTDWMQIEGEVQKPIVEHPKRPVMGMECKRSEVSGARFWELFRRLCPTPESFFNNCAIHNLCPLAFMTETGKNVAPSDMPVKVLRQLDSLCDTTFLEVVALFKVEHVITVGKYAYTCAQKALTAANVTHVALHCMMHPSPANPSANKGWADIAEGQLREFGVYNIIAANPQPPPQAQQQQHQQLPQPPHHQQQQQQQQHQNMHHPHPHAMHSSPHQASAPHMQHPHPQSHHNPHPHHHHQQHYPVPHVLQSTGGVNPIPVGLGMSGGGGDSFGDGKRTYDGVDGNPSQKRMKSDEA